MDIALPSTLKTPVAESKVIVELEAAMFPASPRLELSVCKKEVAGFKPIAVVIPGNAMLRLLEANGRR